MATVDLGAIRFNWRGAYANGTAYVANDVVSSGGSSYMCILASTGNAVSNATYWSIMSTAGTDGTDLGTVLTTQGDIAFRDGSGLQRLAKGTATQTLTMNTGATAPEWAAGGGGAWNYIHTATATNTAYLDFKHGTAGVVLDNTYSVYVFMLKNLVPATQAADLWMKFSTDGGSNWFSSNIETVTLGYDASSNLRSATGVSMGHAFLADNQENATTWGTSGGLYLFDPSNSSGYCSIVGTFVFNSNIASEYAGFQNAGAAYNVVGDVDAVRFMESTGNITSGEIRMYGISDS